MLPNEFPSFLVGLSHNHTTTTEVKSIGFIWACIGLCDEPQNREKGKGVVLMFDDRF